MTIFIPNGEIWGAGLSLARSHTCPKLGHPGAVNSSHVSFVMKIDSKRNFVSDQPQLIGLINQLIGGIGNSRGKRDEFQSNRRTNLTQTDQSNPFNAENRTD